MGFKVRNGLILFFLLGTVACGPSGRDAEVNRVTQALALTARTFVSFFQDDLKNCDRFENIYDELSTSPEPCDGRGFFQLSKLSVSCENSSPLNAQADFVLEQIDCRDNGTGITSSGKMTLSLQFSSQGNIVLMASQELFAQELVFNFQDFQVKINLSSNNLSCSDSGNLTVDGEDCNVASNCRSCRF